MYAIQHWKQARTADRIERQERRSVYRGACYMHAAAGDPTVPATHGELCHYHFEIVLHGKVLHNA